MAALIVLYFPQVGDLRRTSQVVTDVLDSWAGLEIQTVLAIGVLDPRSNHTFQPKAPVIRGELAVALARLAVLVGVPAATAPPVPITDVVPGNAIYRQIQMVLNSGLMSLDDAGNFNAAGRVPGQDAVRAVERLPK